MKYRGVEYTLVQGIERQLWKWSFEFDAIRNGGSASTKSEAIRNAGKAIDRALAVKKVKIVPSVRKKHD